MWAALGSICPRALVSQGIHSVQQTLKRISTPNRLWNNVYASFRKDLQRGECALESEVGRRRSPWTVKRHPRDSDCHMD